METWNETWNTDRLIKLLLFFFVVSLVATLFMAYALFVAVPHQRVIADTGGCGVIYTVQAGETLETIAQKCGVSLTDLEALNPSITDENIAPGQVLTIPRADFLPAPTATEEPTPQPQPILSDQLGGGRPGSGDDQVGGGAPGSDADDQAGGGTPSAAAPGRAYTVVAGDTLSGIAARFGVSLQSVINANPQIDDPNWIFPGDVINIPAAIPPTGGDDDYIVQPGDTLSAIALRFGVTLAQLVAANPHITNPNLIYPGQAVTIPGGSSIPPTGGDGDYVVQPGDTLFSIARLYGTTVEELLALNPHITDPNAIYPGQVILLP